MGYVVAALIVLWGFLGFMWIGENNRINTWMADCQRAGGIVSHVSTSRAECFIDGKEVTLPGWEGY